MCCELGLKKGDLSFVERDEEWDKIAQREIEHLKFLFGPVAKDIQQIGSGAITNPSVRLKFTPILDVAVAVSSFDDVLKIEDKLRAHNIYHIYHRDDSEQLFFSCENMDAGICTAHIYVVLEHSDRWNHFIHFKDYLSVNTDRLRKYNTLKQELAERYATDRRAYHQGKARFIQNIMVEATDYFTLGRQITVVLDRQQKGGQYLRGYHKSYFEKTGKKQIVYVFDFAHTAKEEFHGTVVAMIEYADTGEMKLVATANGTVIYEPLIVHALEKEEGGKKPIYKCLFEKSCGAVLYNEDDGQRKYLLIRNRSQNVGFPKGHIEYGETELQTVKREVQEETGLEVEVCETFRHYYNYKVKFSVHKRAVYYLAKYSGQQVIPQQGEVLEYWEVPYVQAIELLTFDADRKILQDAQHYLGKG